MGIEILTLDKPVDHMMLHFSVPFTLALIASGELCSNSTCDFKDVTASPQGYIGDENSFLQTKLLHDTDGEVHEHDDGERAGDTEVQDGSGILACSEIKCEFQKVKVYNKK